MDRKYTVNVYHSNGTVIFSGKGLTKGQICGKINELAVNIDRLYWQVIDEATQKRKVFSVTDIQFADAV
jgi:hypothetical protein